jgi:hypothetical protein
VGNVVHGTPEGCSRWRYTGFHVRQFESRAIVTEADILAGHFASTRDRLAATSAFPTLVLHDTTEDSPVPS